MCPTRSTEREFAATLVGIPSEDLWPLVNVYCDGEKFWRARTVLDELVQRICPPPPPEPTRVEKRTARLADLTARVDREIRPWRNRCRRMGLKLPPLYAITSLQSAADLLLSHGRHFDVQFILGVSTAHAAMLRSRFYHGRRS